MAKQGKKTASPKDGGTAKSKTPTSKSESTKGTSKSKSVGKSVSAPSGGKLTGDQMAILKRENEKVMKEERKQKIIFVVIIIIAVILMLILLIAGILTIMGADGSSDTSDAVDDSGTHQTLLVTAATVTDSDLKPLPNLTEECRKQHGECFYHLKREPDDCRRTRCTSVHFELKRKKDYREFFISGGVKPAPESKPMKVPDRTYCGKGKWCMAGRCVDHNDSRLFGPDVQPHSGGFEHNCGEIKCLKYEDSQLEAQVKLWSKCPKTREECEKDPRGRDVGCGILLASKQVFVVHWLTLTNPLPQRLPMTTEFPAVIYDRCKACKVVDNKINSLQFSLNAHKFCRSETIGRQCTTGVDWTKFPTYCMPFDMSSNCVPLFKDVPESYGFMPHQVKKCADE